MSQVPVRSPLDLNNIQGDALIGLAKKTQTYLFFQIGNDVDAFRTQLSHLVPLLTTANQAISDQDAITENKRASKENGKEPGLLTLAGVNVAFSHFGLVKMGIRDDIQDSAFTGGQLADAQGLGDPGAPSAGKFEPDWVPAFKQAIDGVILVTGDSHATMNTKLQEVEHIFGVPGRHASIKELLKIQGDVRPGAEKGHEHFGFLDGISQPAVEGINTKPNPGQETVRQGIMLLGRDGDTQTRPSWAVDGTFMVFRYLFQLVPEFNEFLKNNPIVLPGLTREEGSELLGARMMGRWKSGAPVDITPLKDNASIGSDPTKNNNFRYQGEQNSQTRCPFAAHLRKTNPRADLEDLHPSVSTETRRIIRRGLQFGPELTEEEEAEGKTKHDRGLLFVCYQSSIVNGFQFVQEKWANNTAFPPPPPNPPKSIKPGFDPIIGQSGTSVRSMNGSNPSAQGTDLTLPINFVVPRGGEYFFSPCISSIRDTLAMGFQID